jgi:Fungal protein kinase
MNSIMLRHVKDKRVTGVLIDFDPQYGSHLDRRFRTGAALFMAIDLLDGTDKIPLVRHDPESFLWVTIWHTACYHEGIETTMAFQGWRKSKMTNLAEKKDRFLTATYLYKPTEHFAKLALWVCSLGQLFFDARKARNALLWKVKYGGGQTSETLDLETLGGRITYQTFLRILGEL